MFKILTFKRLKARNFCTRDLNIIPCPKGRVCYSAVNKVVRRNVSDEINGGGEERSFSQHRRIRVGSRVRRDKSARTAAAVRLLRCRYNVIGTGGDRGRTGRRRRRRRHRSARMRVGVRGHRLPGASLGHGRPRRQELARRGRGQYAVGNRPASEHRCVPLELVGRPFPLRANGTVPEQPGAVAVGPVPVERRGRLPYGAGARGVRAALCARVQGLRAQPGERRQRVRGARRRPGRRLQAGRVRRGHADVARGRGSRVLCRRQVAVLDRAAADARVPR